MSGPVKRKPGWADLHEEVQAEFAALVGHDRLEVGTERHLNRKRLWELEHKRWLTPVRRAYQRAYCRRDYVLAATRQRSRRNYAARKGKALSDRAPVVCANPRCGVLFVPRSALRRYCTRACKNRASSVRHRARQP